jgi:hypothetical protein
MWGFRVKVDPSSVAEMHEPLSSLRRLFWYSRLSRLCGCNPKSSVYSTESPCSCRLKQAL